MDITKNLIKPALVNDARTSLISEIITDGDWNWVRPDNDKIKFDPGIPANYYESTLAPWMSFPAMETDKQCELVVIGGGLLGASTALHLAESGLIPFCWKRTLSVVELLVVMAGN